MFSHIQKLEQNNYKKTVRHAKLLLEFSLMLFYRDAINFDYTL